MLLEDKFQLVFNGMATAADWMSGASFVAMAGGIYFGGYTYMAFLVDGPLCFSSFTTSSIFKKVWMLHSSRFHWNEIWWKLS